MRHALAGLDLGLGNGVDFTLIRFMLKEMLYGPGHTETPDDGELYHTNVGWAYPLVEIQISGRLVAPKLAQQCVTL